MKIRISCTFGGFLSLVLSLSAQTFTSLVSFNGSNGAYPDIIRSTLWHRL
jgi:hypothetical protein